MWANWRISIVGYNRPEMNSHPAIEVTSRHDTVSENIKQHVTEKVERLVRFHNRISRIQVVMDGVHERPAVELIVHVDCGATLVAKERHEHLRGAVDLAAAKMERQLKKNNGKRKHHKGHTPEPAPEASASPQADAEETYEDAVRESLQG